MLANFVLSGIDNLFNKKLSLQPRKQLFTKDYIKQNLQNVVRNVNAQKQNTRNYQKYNEKHPRNNDKNQRNNDRPYNNKSRLKMILQTHKQQKIRSVVKKNRATRTPSPIHYTKISQSSSSKYVQNTSIDNQQSNISLRKNKSLISFYRQQRKTVQKSRISQNEKSTKKQLKFLTQQINNSAFCPNN